jgi:transcriptional regulator with XRE-family HTH domain
MNKEMHTGERIREMRRKYGVTQEFLADMLGVEHKTVKAWEQGIQQPTIKHLRALAKFFCMKVGELCPGITDKEDRK